MIEPVKPMVRFAHEEQAEAVKVAALLELAKEVNGIAVYRTIGEEEARELLSLMTTSPRTTERIVVYSRHGFVPYSYRGEAKIRFFKAERDEQGQWVVTAGSHSARGDNRRRVTIYPYVEPQETTA